MKGRRRSSGFRLGCLWLNLPAGDAVRPTHEDDRRDQRDWCYFEHRRPVPVPLLLHHWNGARCTEAKYVHHARHEQRGNCDAQARLHHVPQLRANGWRIVHEPSDQHRPRETEYDRRKIRRCVEHEIPGRRCDFERERVDSLERRAQSGQNNRHNSHSDHTDTRATDSGAQVTISPRMLMRQSAAPHELSR